MQQKEVLIVIALIVGGLFLYTSFARTSSQKALCLDKYTMELLNQNCPSVHVIVGLQV